MIPLLLALALAAPEPSDPHAFVRVDTRGAVQSIDAIAQTLAALPDARTDEVAASLRELSVRDPYTRAALQLPFVLDAVVQATPADRFDPVVRAEWASLQAGLAIHVDLLGALDVAPPSPLDAAAPARAAAQLTRVVPTAAQLDASDRARIEALSERVEALTGVARPCPRGPHAVSPGQPWTLGMQLGGWHDALRRVEPFAVDPATRAQVNELIALLDAYSDATFASAHSQPAAR